MKPAAFLYHDPPDLESAAKLLNDLGEGARILAGGQSLVPLLNLRLVRPDHLIDLRRIDSLTRIDLSASALTLGAMTTHRTVETNAVIRRALPLLSEAAANVAHIPIRERGTIGGSLAFADPTAELPLVSVMLDAQITASCVRGSRTIAAAQFFVSAMKTGLGEDEILASVSFPLLGDGQGSAFSEFARRKGDFAIVGVAAQASIAGGRYASIRVGLCGVADCPFLSEAAGRFQGEPAAEPAMHAIADAVAAEIEPADDHRATAEDRRDIARALVRRTVDLATRRALLAQTRGGTAR